jgi:hypothetical protein
MRNFGRRLLFKLFGSKPLDQLLSLELGVGLAHLMGRTLIPFETDGGNADDATGERGRSATAPRVLDLLEPLPIPAAPIAAFGESETRPGEQVRDSLARLSGIVFVDRAAATDPAAIADFAGARTVFSDPQEDVFHLRGLNFGYYSRIVFAPPRSFYNTVERIAPRAPFAALAGQIAQSLGRFNGAHILVDDARKLSPNRGLDYAREILNSLAGNLSADDLLVIATDEPNNAEFFAPIAARFPKHVFLETLIAGEFAPKLEELPASGRAALEWMTHLVLRSAQEFVGTPGSAFSGLTQRHVAIAQARSDLFFEPRPFKFTYPGAATIDVPFDSGLFLETRPGRFSWNRLDWSLDEESMSWYREWPEAVPDQGGAAEVQETTVAQPSGGTIAAPQRRFTMSTTFQGAYVPPQISSGRDADVARRGIERSMQAIACDLMFGADRSKLIQRIVALGAPPAEAKRIIDTAYDDPLIANGRAMAAVLRKRDWLLEAMERQRRLWPPAAVIERREAIGAHEFLERFYAQSRPVILTDAMQAWNALRWTPASLTTAAGEEEIVCRGATGQGRAGAADAIRRMSFARFLEIAERADAQDARYLLADGHLHNPALARRLRADHGSLGALLDTDAAQSCGMLWIGASNALTPLHHDLVNSLVAQIAGRNRFRIIPACEVAKLHNHLHVLSEIEDLDAPGIDATRYSGLADVRTYDIVLAPGEILYLPLAWWYQVRSAGFAISATYTNFRWPNDFYRTYPAR